jgi:hypothetical protein
MPAKESFGIVRRVASHELLAKQKRLGDLNTRRLVLARCRAHHSADALEVLAAGMCGDVEIHSATLPRKRAILLAGASRRPRHTNR